ncbi:hypothetical protein FRUB_06894 [Fimbriiglobus ruber]|uniref:Uncharacterized protein n=1 Tax=Fimbriiglobus ruber TaxID=1908690 RepID=A0A225DDR6_9BACT|nr:hypothetical protein FRUB_06894 [Fimbriiglobus ruber]
MSHESPGWKPVTYRTTCTGRSQFSPYFRFSTVRTQLTIRKSMCDRKFGP